MIVCRMNFRDQSVFPDIVGPFDNIQDAVRALKSAGYKFTVSQEALLPGIEYIITDNSIGYETVTFTPIKLDFPRL